MKEALATRTFYCENCERLGFPRKQTIYVVFGKTHGSYDLRFHAGNVDSRNVGMTPHIIFPEMLHFPVKKGEDTYVIQVLCGVVGCGFRIKKSNQDGLWWIHAITSPKYQKLKEADLINLVNFKDHSFYLGETPQEKWNIENIVNEQMEIFRKARCTPS